MTEHYLYDRRTGLYNNHQIIEVDTLELAKRKTQKARLLELRDRLRDKMANE